jgi:PAS domain S-box-containing protein
MSRSSRFVSGALLVCLASALMFGLASLGLVLDRKDEGLAAVWLANAVIIALLLRQPRARWFLLAAGTLAGNVAAGLGAGDPLALSLALSLCNLAEILLVAGLFVRHGPHQALDSVASLGRLAALAVAGPLITTPLAGLILVVAGEPVSMTVLAQWTAADMRGILILVPLLLTLAASGTPGQRDRGFEFGLLLALSLVASVAVFSRQSSFLFLLTPVLVLAGLRLSLGRAALLVTLVCACGLIMTFAGMGPIALGELDPSNRAFLLQAFMATVVTLVLPVAALSRERMLAASALRHSDEHYRLLADHGSDLVLRLDRDGQALFVSSAARRMLGLPESALMASALHTHLHLDDVPRFVAAVQRAQRVGEAVTCFRMRHARGSWRWIEAHLRLAGANSANSLAGHSCEAAVEGRCQPERAGTCMERGEHAVPLTPVGAGAGTSIVATLRDITQRRQAEMRASESAARLRETNRLLLMAEELASLGHWVYDPLTEKIILSAEAATLLDLSQLAMTPADALGLLLGEDRRDVLRCLALARRRDNPAECIVRVKRGHELRTLQLRIQQTGTHDPSPALFGVISDMTDKLDAEQRLVAALEEARSAAEFRSQFLATMSHEIRTPMTGVIGMIELLADEHAPHQRQLYVDTLRQSADLLMAVLDDILDFSKVDAGRLTFADEAFDVGKLLQTTSRLFERAASSRGLTLALEAPEPGTLWLRGDALRLQQVLSDLLSNAIKFSERGEVSLRCSVHPRSDGLQDVRLHVEDKGVGIAPALQEKLFEPFVQGEAVGPGGGTGLGLAISRRLVAGMGGSIAVCSTEGEGSIFAVRLALAGAEAADDSVGEPRVPMRALDILLAEDNVVNQLLVTALLKRMGHRITCAADGEAAVDCAAGRRFDLILMDMQMPRRDGLSATGAIRAGAGLNAATPIIALTADAAMERRPLYESGGIDAVLTKPIDSRALQSLLTAWTHSQHEGSRAPVTLDPNVSEEVRSIVGQAGLDDLLDLLADELEARPRAIRDALLDRDFDKAAAETHSLKGASANLGACAVADAACALERAIARVKAGEGSDLAPALRRLSASASDTQHALAALPRATAPLALQA